MRYRVAFVLFAALVLGGCGITINTQPSGTHAQTSTAPPPKDTGTPSSPSGQTQPNQSQPNTSVGPSAIPGSPPPAKGYLGIQMTDPPADWTAQGCEVVHAIPGEPAANAGLVGSEDRTDPVGDVIDAISLAGTMTQIPNCAALTSTLATTHPGEEATIYYQHRAASFLVGSWQPEQVMLYLGPPPCPPAITGQITSPSSGNRIPLQIALVGPQQTVQFNAILDTGADQTTFPENELQQAGFTSFASGPVSGVVPGAQTQAYAFRVPANDIEVWDSSNNEYVPLGYGTIVVWGIPDSGSNPVDSLIGPDMLRLGASLSVQGSNWTLTPPCP